MLNDPTQLLLELATDRRSEASRRLALSVTLWNPLGWNMTYLHRLPVPFPVRVWQLVPESSGDDVVSSDAWIGTLVWREVPSQVETREKLEYLLTDHDPYKRQFGYDAFPNEVVFQANIGPLGFASYYLSPFALAPAAAAVATPSSRRLVPASTLSRVLQPESVEASAPLSLPLSPVHLAWPVIASALLKQAAGHRHPQTEAEPAADEEIFIDNGHYRITFSKTTGEMLRILNYRLGATLALTQSFYEYQSMRGNVANGMLPTRPLCGSYAAPRWRLSVYAGQ